jgi:hypothetical protein
MAKSTYVSNAIGLKTKLKKQSEFCVKRAFFKSARARSTRAEFTIIPYPGNFVKRNFAQKLPVIFSRNCAIYHLANWVKVCYNLKCQGDRDVGRPSYGLSAVCVKATKKNKKIIENLLTNPTRCGIIQVFQGNEIKNWVATHNKKGVVQYG